MPNEDKAVTGAPSGFNLLLQRRMSFCVNGSGILSWENYQDVVDYVNKLKAKLALADALRDAAEDISYGDEQEYKTIQRAIAAYDAIKHQ